MIHNKRIKKINTKVVASSLQWRIVVAFIVATIFLLLFFFVMYTYQTIKLYNNFSQNISYVNAVLDAGKITLITAGVALVISLTIGLILARTIIRPIKKLVVKADEIAQGNFETVLPVKGHNEISRLTQSVNDMSAEIKNNLSEISGENNKFEEIISFMNEGILAYDQHGALIQINPAAIRIMQWDEYVPKKFEEAMKRLCIDVSLESIVNNKGKEENPETQINRYVQINGISLHIYITVFSNMENAVEGILVVMRDITEQSRLDDMRKEFVANVSHEIRTPLTSIKLYSETLLEGNDIPIASIGFLKVINSEAERMSRLAEDLLQLSRVDSGAIKWNMQMNDINKLAADVTQKQLISAKEKEQQLVFVGREGLPQTLCDADKIKQVIINVVSNGMKYTPNGGKIAVRTGREGDSIFISVKDNGIGIKKDDQDRMFDRFFRVDKARSRDIGGTGLGLSIVKELVKAHNGKITVQSELGLGTEIRIFLPIIT